MTGMDVSRRDLIAAAGLGVAGAALAGCDALNAGGDRATPALGIKQVRSLLSEFIAERKINNYGHNPNAAPIGPSVAFKPRYMLVIHMTSSGPWAINSNQAHFEFAEADKAKRIAHASKICLNKLGKAHKRFRDVGRRAPFSPYDRTPAAPQAWFADSVEFAEFDFLYQHDIYIFYEHKAGEVLFDPDQLVTYSQYTFGGAQAAENHAFFNAELVDPALTGGLASKGSLVRIENHYTVWKNDHYELIGPEGQVLPPGAAKLYKMNMVYIAGSSGIPMLIDPDEGNGMGNYP